MNRKNKKCSVVVTVSGRERDSASTTDAERYEQLAGLGVTGKAFSVLEVVSLNPQATRMAEIIRRTGMTIGPSGRWGYASMRAVMHRLTARRIRPTTICYK